MRVARHLAMVLLIATLAGCGSFQKPQAPDKTLDEPSKASPQTADCDWTQQRGIAELVEINESEGRFLFHPDGISVTRSVHKDWAEGDEFKAILERAEPPDCAEERLIELKPLAPTD